MHLSNEIGGAVVMLFKFLDPSRIDDIDGVGQMGARHRSVLPADCCWREYAIYYEQTLQSFASAHQTVQCVRV